MYPDFYQAIVLLAMAGFGADWQRLADVLNACKTLDDLRTDLQKEGYILSWQAHYLCLILRKTDNTEAKQHV